LVDILRLDERLNTFGVDGCLSPFIHERNQSAGDLTEVRVNFEVCFESYCQKVNAAVVVEKDPIRFDDL
jgi:hypothetical protein